MSYDEVVGPLAHLREKLDRSEAILKKRRNTRRGLKMRNEILKYLFHSSQKSSSTREVAEGAGVSYRVASYHLKNMLEDGVVEKLKVGRAVRWKITGFGQQTIKKWIEQESSL